MHDFTFLLAKIVKDVNAKFAVFVYIYVQMWNMLAQNK